MAERRTGIIKSGAYGRTVIQPVGGEAESCEPHRHTGTIKSGGYGRTIVSPVKCGHSDDSSRARSSAPAQQDEFRSGVIRAASPGYTHTTRPNVSMEPQRMANAGYVDAGVQRGPIKAGSPGRTFVARPTAASAGAPPSPVQQPMELSPGSTIHASSPGRTSAGRMRDEAPAPAAVEAYRSYPIKSLSPTRTTAGGPPDRPLTQPPNWQEDGRTLVQQYTPGSPGGASNYEQRRYQPSPHTVHAVSPGKTDAARGLDAKRDPSKMPAAGISQSPAFVRAAPAQSNTPLSRELF